MLILNPERVELGTAVLDRVTSVTVESTTVSPIEEWSAAGPWCRLVDSPKRRVTVVVKQEPGGGPLTLPPDLGAQAELRVTVSPNASDRARRRIRCTCVVVATRYEHPSGRPPVRTVSLLAVSTTPPAGVTDPVVIEEVSP